MNFARTPKFLRFLGRRLFCVNGQPASTLDNSCISFYMKIFKLSQRTTKDLLTKQPCLWSSAVDFDDVQTSADFLCSQNISSKEILRFPTSLLLNRTTFENRIEVLKECRFNKIELLFLHRFVTVMNKQIKVLKAFKYIDEEVKVAETLAKLLDKPIDLNQKLDDSKSLKETRKVVISLYLKARLDVTDEEVEKFWKTYSRITHRSLKSIVDVLDLLENEIGFTKQKIIRNGFIIYACANNIRQILKDFPTIGGLACKDLLLRNPKIAMTNVDSIKETLQHLKTFEIPEDRVLKCEEILTLGPTTVKERLLELSKIDEFKVLVDNEGILKLLHNQNKAKIRLEFLKQLKVKCVSLNVLSHSSDCFERYAKGGKDRTKGYELLHFLGSAFDVEKEQMRNTLNRHPNWCFVPVMEVKQSIDYLRAQGFTDQDLAENIHLLLYPTHRIEQKLSSLIGWKSRNGDQNWIAGEPLSEVSNCRLLSLCLYFIEAEFHFSGNGMWDTDRHDGKQDMTTPSTLDFPDSLKKVNRFGVTQKMKMF